MNKKSLKKFEKNYGRLEPQTQEDAGLSLASETKDKEVKELPKTFELPCKPSVPPATS
jgi:hypothetical protein